MSILGAISYDPAAAATKVCSSRLAMTAMDTTNLRLTFTAPVSGKVMVRLSGVMHGATSLAQILLGILSGATVVARKAPMTVKGTVAATDLVPVESVFTVTGLTPGSSYTWDAAYGVETEVASSAIKYGGPDNTTANDAFGAFGFQIWGL